MTRRALLIGSPADGIRGVEPSVDAVDQFLSGLGFVCKSLVGAAATRAGILAALADLVLATHKDDVVVLYYAGHGELFLARRSAAPGDARERTHGVLVTMDMINSDAEHFLGVLGLELSVWMYKLEQRTANITAILDCCHADAVLAALTAPEVAAAAQQIPRIHSDLARALEKSHHRGSQSTPGSVRLMASTAGIEAYMDPDGERLLFTDRLLAALRDPEIRDQWTWDQILRKVRGEVLRANDAQRPSIAGARHRRPFTTTDQPEPAESFHVETVDDTLRIPHGAINGLRQGDLLELRDYAHGAGWGRAWVRALTGADAVLALGSPTKPPPWCWACRIGHASALKIDADEPVHATLRAGGFHPADPDTDTRARVRLVDGRCVITIVDTAGEHEVAAPSVANVAALHAALRRIEHWDALQRWISGQRGRLEDCHLTWSIDGGPPQADLTRDDTLRGSLGVVVTNPGIRHSQLFVRVLRVDPDLTLAPFAGGRATWSVACARSELERYKLREYPRAARRGGVLVAVADGPFELDALVTPARDKVMRGGAARGLEGTPPLGRASVIELFHREFSLDPAAS